MQWGAEQPPKNIGRRIRDLERYEESLPKSLEIRAPFFWGGGGGVVS